jgi:chromosome segregation ATPase
MESTQLINIQKKLQQLLQQHQFVLKEHEKLKNKLSQLEAEKQNQLQQVAQLNNEINLLKVSLGTADSSAKKEFDKRINKYVKEIDRCLALLGE